MPRWMRTLLPLALPLVVAGVVAADPVAGGGDPALPERLSATGLYGPGGELAPGVHPFSPQYPLWSDGADKRRWILLPAGATIDASDPDRWHFPVGTKLWKEFAWGGQKVETRLLWRATEERWLFATYAWAADQPDAILAPAHGLRGAHPLPGGRAHSLPSVADCHACHQSGPSVVLGFNAWQLSDDRDPLAPHAEALPAGAWTLRGLLDGGWLQPAAPSLRTVPPRIAGRDPVERAALGYLSANCGGCHNGLGPQARLGLELLHRVGGSGPPIALATAVDRSGKYKVPGVDPAECRVVAPGAPHASSVWHRMRSRSPASQMPPLGTVLVDSVAVELVGRWIAGLPLVAMP